MTEEESKALMEKAASASVNKVGEAPAPVKTEAKETSAVAHDGASLGSLPIPSIVVQPGSEEEVPSSPPTDVDQNEAAEEKDREPPSTPTPVSTDILLPLLIFSVVKANPAHLVSHLLFTQRFRNSSPTLDRHSHLLALPGGGGGGVGRGEERFCVVNLMGVVQFLESVDFGALGLGGEKERERVVKELGVGAVGVGVGVGNVTPLTPIAGGEVFGLGVLRGRVEQATMGVLSGVVGTGVGVLRALLPGGAVAAEVNVGGGGAAVNSFATTANGVVGSPSGVLLGRAATPVSAAVEGSAGSGFSLRSITAALPVSIPHVGRRRGGGGEGEGQQLVEVASFGMVGEDAGSGFEDEDEDGEEDEEESEDGDDGPSDAASMTVGSDPKSIRSFESMLGGNVRGKRRGKGGHRKSLTDRLARISSLAALKVCFFWPPFPSERYSVYIFFCRDPRHRVLYRFSSLRRSRQRRRLLVLLHLHRLMGRRRHTNHGHRV